MKVIKTNFWLLTVFLYYIFSSIIYAILSVAKYNHFSQIVGDLCIFSQGIWQYSQFKWPISSFHLDKPFLADHFHPILMTLAPFYWFYPNERILLILQPFILLSSMIPIFLITRHLTKSILLGLTLIFCYSFYIPIQYALFFEFHEIVFLPPLFAWAFYFFIKGKKNFVFLFLILTLLVKEEAGFFVSAFGLYLLIFAKGWRKFGLTWLILGIFYSLLIIHLIIPSLGGPYNFSDFGESGKSPLEVFLNILKNPLKYLNLFYNSSIKQETLYRTFWPFAFLPLLSPLGLLLSLEQFASRFFDLKTTNRWTIYYHYSIPLAITVILATLETVKNLKKKIKSKWFIFILCVLLIVLTRLQQVNASAVLLAKRPEFWQKPAWIPEVEEVISKVDKNVSISSSKEIACRLSTREKVYFLSDKKDTEFVIIHSNPTQLQEWDKKSYKIIYQKGETFLLKKD